MPEDPRVTGHGDPTPILIQTRLRLPPWLLEAMAQQSKSQNQSLEEVIVETLSQDFRNRGPREPGDALTDSLLNKTSS